MGLKRAIVIGVMIGVVFVEGSSILVYGGESGTQGAQKMESPVLARIGDRTITLEEFNQVLKASPQIAGTGDAAQRKKLLLEHFVNQFLFVEDAVRMEMDKRPDVVRMLEDLRFQVLLNVYHKELGLDRVTMGEEEVRAYWEQHPQEFTIPLEVRYRQMLIQADKDDHQGASALRRAEEVLAKVRAGEDFSKLATKYSDDPNTKGVGGEQGFVQKGKLPPEVDAVVFALKPGETSGIIRTETGYVIVRVEDRREPKLKPLSMVQRQITELLLRKRQQEIYQRQVEAVKQRIPVEIHPERLEQGGR